MTYDEIISAVNSASSENVEAVAESVLERYNEPDKELVSSWVWEMVALKMPSPKFIQAKP